MITEISNYVKSIEDSIDFIIEGSESLPNGRYMLFEVSNKKDWQLIFTFSVPENDQANEDQKITEYLKESEIIRKLRLTKIISTQKVLDSGNRKIHSNNPFFVNFSKANTHIIDEPLKKFFINTRKLYLNILEQYELSDLINKAEIKCKEVVEEIKSSLNNFKEDRIFILFNQKVEFFIDIQKRYLQEYIFLDRTFNTDDGKLGLCDFMSTANSKKPFLLPKTAFIKGNNYINSIHAWHIHLFKEMLNVNPKKMPNPLPIFIYEEELNNRVIGVIKQTGRVSYHEIIKSLYSTNKIDLHNYYLINWSKGKKRVIINDFDFVENTRFETEAFTVYDLFNAGGNETKIAATNIFQFEQEICNKIFFGLLITPQKDNSLIYHYFDEISGSESIFWKSMGQYVLNYFDDISGTESFKKLNTKKILHNLNLYRIHFYNYIYKGRKSALSGELFYRIIIENSFDYLIKSENPYLTKLRDALNILFSLNKNFDTTNKNFGGRDMPTQIPEYYNNLAKLFQSTENHLDDDYFYAFAAGQVVYYLLSQSKTANKTHSLFEPFMNKSNVNSFNEQLIRVFNQYKHELNFNSRKFNRLFSEVLGYEPKTSFNELRVIILTGYLSDNILYSNNNKKTEEIKNAE